MMPYYLESLTTANSATPSIRFIAIFHISPMNTVRTPGRTDHCTYGESFCVVTIFSVTYFRNEKKIQPFLLVVCKKGYTRDADSGRCVKCPMGTFSDTVGDASCTSCPEGTTTTIEAADDASSCIGENITVLRLYFAT